MELEYAFLALNADRSKDGKLFIFGADFDEMRVSSLPGEVPPFVAVVKFRVRPDEANIQHQISIGVSNPEGKRSPGELPRPLATERNPRNPENDSFSQVIAVIQTTFDLPGEYTFHFVVDGVELGRLPLFVSVAAPNPEDQGKG